MNYFFSELRRGKFFLALAGLAALAGLIIMDLLTYMLMPTPVFNLWVIKVAAAAALVSAIIYGIFLNKREKRGKRLDALLPDFLIERRSVLEKLAAADPEFQTLCHRCSHFDLARLACLLDLRERRAWVKLNDESPVRYCLYWNLADGDPVLQLTARLGAAMEEAPGGTGRKAGQ
jgi:hypothetical protein